SGGIVPSAAAELRLSAHVPPLYEVRSSDRRETYIAFFRVQRPCGTADLVACERHISATTSGAVPRRAPRKACVETMRLGRRATRATNDSAVASENGPYRY